MALVNEFALHAMPTSQRRFCWNGHGTIAQVCEGRSMSDELLKLKPCPFYGDNAEVMALRFCELFGEPSGAMKQGEWK